MAAPAAVRPNRDRVLEALRSAGPDGLSGEELHAHGGAGVGAHVESLRYEGFRISSLPERHASGRSDTRYILAHDPEAHGGRSIAGATSRRGSEAEAEPGSPSQVGSPAREREKTLETTESPH